MALSNAGKHIALDAIAAVATYASLHTADPSTTGASEVAGGSYARQSHTWNAASSGNLDDSNQPVFTVPASTTVTHFGLWSASTGGTFYGGAALSASETFGPAGGTYTLTDCDISIT